MFVTGGVGPVLLLPEGYIRQPVGFGAAPNVISVEGPVIDPDQPPKSR